MKPDNDGFLERWSRRKAAARPEAEELAGTLEPAAEEAAADDADELTDAELLEKLELPDPDQMASGDDFAAFMRDGVPARLRNRALRKLWLTNPTLANLDELLDYGGDFTDAATVIPGMKTIYQVGRGIVLPEEDDESAEEGVREGARADVDESAEESVEDNAEENATEPEGEAIASENSDGAPDEHGEAAPTGMEAPARAVPDVSDGEAGGASVPLPLPASPARAMAVASEPTQRRRRMAFRFE